LSKLRLSRGDATKWANRVFRSESSRAALILIVILNILFFPCVWGNKTMLESARLWPSIVPTGALAEKTEPITWGKTADGAAAAWFFEPALAVTGNDYWSGTLPLWNPYQAYGQPFAAGMQAQPFFPLTILLSLHVTPWTYNLYLLTRLFIAGFFTYLFLRLFLDFLPAVTGGVAIMLGGYYLLEMVMPHLSVEMLTPAAFFAGERLLRRHSYGNLLAFTAILFLINLGGMPESALLLFALLYCYLVLRIAVEVEIREWFAAAGWILLPSLAALCLSSVILLPFVEFLRHGYNTHDLAGTGGAMPGLLFHWFSANVFNYLFPLLYGPYRELSNEFGIIVFFFILISLFGIFAKSKHPAKPEAESRLRFITIFFLICLALLAMKRYGVQPINEIGRLPFFRLVDMYKYDEALVTFCAAVLCGVGAQRLLRRDLPQTVIAIGLVVAFAMIPLAAYEGQSTIVGELKSGLEGRQVPAKYPEIALGLAAIVLFFLAISVFLFDKRRRRLGVAVLLLLTTELSLNFVPSIYYIDAHLPTEARDPYAGAPYVTFLQRHTENLERIFARESVLYPDWASVFRLGDIRDLDAMYYWRYLPFLRNFIQPPPFARASELWDRFDGADLPYNFGTALERRLLQLSSAKYVISMTPYAAAPFKLVYDREVKIYEFPEVLPRAALYYQAEVESGAGDVLKKLADPGFNIFQTALLERANVKSVPGSTVAQLARGTAKPAESARISSYGPSSVEIDASPSRDSLLVLNDSAYPGWTATVDGRTARLLTVNFLFRGVMLKAGRHVVRFVYRPKPFYEGLALAGLTVLGLAIPGLRSLRNRRKNTGSAVTPDTSLAART
jgi:Bacterial membrane protein YfhO